MEGEKKEQDRSDGAHGYLHTQEAEFQARLVHRLRANLKEKKKKGTYMWSSSHRGPNQAQHSSAFWKQVRLRKSSLSL